MDFIWDLSSKKSWWSICLGVPIFCTELWLPESSLTVGGRWRMRVGESMVLLPLFSWGVIPPWRSLMVLRLSVAAFVNIFVFYVWKKLQFVRLHTPDL